MTEARIMPAAYVGSCTLDSIFTMLKAVGMAFDIIALFFCRIGKPKYSTRLTLCQENNDKSLIKEKLWKYA